MKRLTASLLAAGLVLAGHAAAQSSEYYSSQDPGRYSANGYSSQQATYDYARVLRVDPVIGSGVRGRSSTNSRQCHDTRSDGVYVGNEPDSRNDGYYSGSDGYRRDDGYYRRDGYTGRNDGYGTARGSETNRTVATVIGGIAGAVLGSKIGNGSGSYVGTAVGSMVGGMAGRSIYDSSVRNRQYERRGIVSVCDPEPVNGRDGYYDRDGDVRDEELAGYEVTYEYANRTYTTRTNYHPGDRIRVRVDVRPE